MSKDECCELLRQKGYKAHVFKGAIMVAVSDWDYSTNRTMRKIREILKEAGYKGSFGMTAVRKEVID